MSFADDKTRRRVLRLGVALLAGAAAGCAGSDSGTSAPQDESVFRGTEFDGPDLVVELRADHGASRVNLIGPDGSAFAGTDVATGATTVRLPILRIQPSTGFRHYEPGVHGLVAVLEDRAVSMDLDLRPELRVTDVEPSREGSQASDAGRLAVTVENVGTAPSWVYDVTYEDAPNESANDELSDDPGAPFLLAPSASEELIIGPNAGQTYVGTNVPILFSDEEQSQCSSSVEFAVVIGRAVGEPLKRQIRAVLGGEVRSVGLTGEYTCSAIEVEVLGGESSG